MKRIEVLGVGCPSCIRAEREIRKVLEKDGHREGETFILEKVTEPVEIMARGVFATPGVVVDGKVVSVGKIPWPGEIRSWMR